jgi:hypothetical protein
VPAAFSRLIVTGCPSPAVAGTVNTFSVSATDDFGNVITDYQGALHFTSSDPQAIVPHDYTFTVGDHGRRVFAAVLRTAGAQTLTATDALAGGPTGAQSIVVVPGAVSRLVVKDFPAGIEAGSVSTFTVTALDAFGNTVTGYRGVVRFTSTDPQAILPVDYAFTAADNGTHIFGAVLATAGGQSLTATDVDTGVGGAQTDIQVAPAAASYLVLHAPDQVQADEVFELTVTAYDAYGNVATGYTGTVTFASSGSDALLPQDYAFTADDAGAHTFRALLRNPGLQDLAVLDRLMNDLMGSVSILVLMG